MNERETVLVVDGQGGRMGRLVVETLKKTHPDIKILAVGTNTMATTAMLKGGADAGATGENAVVVALRDAHIVIGPLGIVLADSMMGEITPAMSVEFGRCKAHKILIPTDRCNTYIAGVERYSMSEMVARAVDKLDEVLDEHRHYR